MKQNTFSVHFVVRNDRVDEEGYASIYARVVVNGKKLRITTNQKVQLKDWNAKKGIPLPRAGNCISINEAIQALETRIRTAYSKLVASSEFINLMVGGVKAYNLDNLYQKSGADQTFKIFIGFQNKVCTNLCVWSDGYVGDLRVKDTKQLHDGIQKMFYQYDLERQLRFLHGLDNYSLIEHQFAQLIGRCRLYPHLSHQQKLEIPALSLSDTQLNVVAKDYYRDQSFSRDESGDINLWRLYNLFTGANKSSYIDTFLDRTVNATSFIGEIKNAVAHKQTNWFLN